MAMMQVEGGAGRQDVRHHKDDRLVKVWRTVAPTARELAQCLDTHLGKMRDISEALRKQLRSIREQQSCTVLVERRRNAVFHRQTENARRTEAERIFPKSLKDDAGITGHWHTRQLQRIQTWRGSTPWLSGRKGKTLPDVWHGVRTAGEKGAVRLCAKRHQDLLGNAAPAQMEKGTGGTCICRRARGHCDGRRGCQ